MIAPRYLPRLSEDLTVWNLFAPATEEDREWAVGTILPRLVAVPWRLNRTERVTLARLRQEWGRPGELAAPEVKLGLLYLALSRLLATMYEPQAARFAEVWTKDDTGARWHGSPAKEWGRLAEPRGDDSFILDPPPTAQEVDRFARWLEQQLIRYAREALRSMAPDTLPDGLQWLQDGPDMLDKGKHVISSLTTSEDGSAAEPINIDEWDVCYRLAVTDLRRILSRARFLALISCFEGIHAHRTGAKRPRRRRLSDGELQRIRMNLRRIPDKQCDEVRPLVFDALQAVRELAARYQPLPNLG